MTMTLQEISDRLEIQDLLTRYSVAIDRKDFQALDNVFTEDAWIDYSAMGGAKGNLEEIKAFLTEVMPIFPHTQHLVSNPEITLNGDEASGRIMCFNPQEMEIAPGQRQVMFLGLWYLDKYRRTEQGWRICERSEEKCYDFNTPDFMTIGPKE